MFSSSFSAIAVFALLCLLVSLVQSTDNEAGPAVKRDVKPIPVYDSLGNTFAKKDSFLTEKRKSNEQEETVFGAVAQPCAEDEPKAYIQARAAYSTLQQLQTSATSTSLASTAATGLSAQCVCTETGCTPESPPCCGNGSCNLKAKNTGSEGVKLRLTFCITIVALAFSFFMC